MTEITVIYHEEDGLWWAESDQVPGWAAGGDSREEARERVLEGLPFFLGEEVAIDERFPSSVNDFEVLSTSGIVATVDAHVTTGLTPHVRLRTHPFKIGILVPGGAPA